MEHKAGTLVPEQPTPAGTHAPAKKHISIVGEAKQKQSRKTTISLGANFHALAGRPKKEEVIAVFGKSGYAMSWVGRANILGFTPEHLCEKFKEDPQSLIPLWEEATKKEETEQETN